MRFRLGVAAMAMMTAGAAGAQDAPSLGSMEIAPGVTAHVTGLTRVPTIGVVQLDWRIDNASGAPVELGDLSLLLGYCVGEVDLIDFAGATQYGVATGGGECTASSVYNQPSAIQAGASFEGWAWYQPPLDAQGPFAVRFGSAMPILDVVLQ